MTDEPFPIPVERLEELRALAQHAGVQEMVWAIDEMFYWRELFTRLYHTIPDIPGTEALQAELERQAERLGLIKPGKPNMH